MLCCENPALRLQLVFWLGSECLERHQNSPSEHTGHYSFANHAVSEGALGVQSTISALILCALIASSHPYSHRITLLAISPERPAETVRMGSAHCHLAPVKNIQQ